MLKDYYSQSPENIEKELDTNVQLGLSSAKAKERLEKDGFNALATEKGKSMLARFIDRFKDFMIIVLLIAALVFRCSCWRVD